MIIQPRSIITAGQATTLRELFGSALIAEYDARDTANLFQDTSATIPVTTALDPVSLWKDKGGNVSRLLQNNTDTGGLWNGASGYNGVPQVVFDATTYFYLYADYTLAQPCQIFSVFATISTVTDFGTIWDGGGGSGNTMRMYYSPPNGSDSLIMFAGGFGPIITGRIDDTLIQARCLYNGASSTFKYNGGTVATGDVGSNTPGGLTLGCYGNRATGFQKVGFSYLAIINRAATALENTRAESILQTAFGLPN